MSEKTEELIKRKRIRKAGKWEKNEIIKLITFYEENEHLWNITRIDYKDRYKRSQSLNKIANELNKDVGMCTNKWNSLRVQFNSEKKRMMDRRSRQSSDANYESKWEFYKSLSFLNKCTTSTSSLNMNILIDPFECNLSNSSLAVSDKEIQSEHETKQFTDEQDIPSTSQYEYTYPKIKEIQSLGTSDNAAETTEDYYKFNPIKRRNKHNHSLSHSSTYDELQQNKQGCVKTSENINLKSFGEYIDTELEKLDKATCAIVKIKIQKIIYETILKSCKKDDTEVTNKLSDVDDNDEEITGDDDDGDNMVQNSYLEEVSKESCKNKENEAPISSVLCKRKASQLTNAEEEQTKGVKKKSFKSRDTLSDVHDTIQIDTKNAEQTVTFGTYVVNELKFMDNLTVTNVKLKICQILYQALLGK